MKNKVMRDDQIILTDLYVILIHNVHRTELESVFRVKTFIMNGKITMNINIELMEQQIKLFNLHLWIRFCY